MLSETDLNEATAQIVPAIAVIFTEICATHYLAK